MPQPAGPLSAQRVAVVLNPSKVGAESAVNHTILACRKAGWEDPRFFETTVEDTGTSMTRDALDWGADVILAAGGDGTVRTVAEVLAGTSTPLGLIPMGTGNLLARNLGAHLDDIHHSVDVALFGDHQRIDMVSFTTETDDGAVAEQALCVMGGVGFDAEIMEHTSDRLKKRIGWMAYGEAGMRRVLSAPVWARFRLDDGPWQSRRLRSIMAANCGTLTGGLVLLPGAELDDGVLDVVVIAPRHLLGWVRLAGKVVFQHRHPLPELDHYECRKVRAEFHEPTSGELDGDGVGRVVAFEAEIMPGALTLRVPPTLGDESLNLLDDETEQRHPHDEPAIQADFHRHRSSGSGSDAGAGAGADQEKQRKEGASEGSGPDSSADRG